MPNISGVGCSLELREHLSLLGPTSHLSTISFYFTSRSTDVWVSTRLASSILLAISALFFHREPSAGTHGVFVFVSSGTKCWNPRCYCLCSRPSFQGTLRAAARVTSFSLNSALVWFSVFTQIGNAAAKGLVWNVALAGDQFVSH